MSDTPVISLAGERFLPVKSGVLFHERSETLIVSDLHLEKGSSYARSGQLLPPYDSLTTLKFLMHSVFLMQPRRIVALGDSFHDAEAWLRLGAEEHEILDLLRAQAEWVWVTGNHDEELEGSDFASEAVEELYIGRVALRHEASLDLQDAAEISGHYHPKARTRVRGSSISKRCFAFDRRRLILPAFGAYTGGLNVLATPLRRLFAETFSTLMITGKGIYRFPDHALIPPRHMVN